MDGLRHRSAISPLQAWERMFLMSRRPKLLVVASGGGHWEQLMLLRPAFADADVTYVTTMAGLAERSGVEARLVPDCNRHEKGKALHCAVRLLWLILRLRPDAIISTGALPGFFAVAIGRRLGARTMWVDSVANAEEMSMAGKLVRNHADRWLSQWSDVAQSAGAEWHGAVL